MNPYERFVLPWLLEHSCGIGPIQKKRQALVPRAQGRVLEIGIGTGHNIPFYDSARVTEVIAVDPAEQMHGKALERARVAGLDVRVLGLPAERIPLDDGSIDSIVMTFTLCTIPDAAAALAEMRRVLKPGGELVFCEHGLSPDEGVRKWQGRFNSLQNRVAGGCNLNRDIPALVGQEFAIGELEQAYIPGPKPWGYLYSGTAT